MSDNQQKPIKTKGIKTRNDNLWFTNNPCIQNKKELKILEGKERQKNLNQSIQEIKSNSFQKNKKEVNGQSKQTGMQAQQNKNHQKRKLLDKIMNIYPSNSQKLNQNLKTLQQIEEFQLNGKKVIDLPDKSQFFITPQIQKNISLESQNKLNIKKKFVDKSFNLQSQTTYPNIMKQQVEIREIINQKQLNFAEGLLVKSKTQNNIPQIIEQTRKEKEKIKDANQNIQKVKEFKFNRFLTKEVLKIIAQNQQNQIENNYHPEISNIQQNGNKIDKNQTQLRDKSLENQDQQLQKHFLPNIDVTNQNSLNIKIQFQLQKDQKNNNIQSVKSSRIKSYNQQLNQSFQSKRKEYQLQNSETLDSLIKSYEDKKENLSKQSLYIRQSFTSSFTKKKQKKKIYQSQSNSLIQNKIKKKQYERKQLSQTNVLNTQLIDEQLQKETFTSIARKIIADGSSIYNNMQETNNNSVIQKQNSKYQKQKALAYYESKSFESLKSKYIQNSRNKFPLSIVTKENQDQNQNIQKNKIQEKKTDQIQPQTLDNQSKNIEVFQESSQVQTNNQRLTNSFRKKEQRNKIASSLLQQASSKQDESCKIQNILKKKFKKKSLKINKSFYSGYSQQFDLSFSDNLNENKSSEINYQEERNKQQQSIQIQSLSNGQNQIYSRSQSIFPEEDSKSGSFQNQQESFDKEDQIYQQTKSQEKIESQNNFICENRSIQQNQVIEVNQLNIEDDKSQNSSEYSSFTRNFKEIISLAQSNTSIFQSIHSDMIIISKE